MNYLGGSVTEEKLFKAPCASVPGLPRSRAKSGAKLPDAADDTHNISVTVSKITSSGAIARHAGPRPAPANVREGSQGLRQKLWLSPRCNRAINTIRPCFP